MTLQTQGVLRLGVEDHLASSRTNGESRSNRPLPHAFQKTAEIFEAHLRVGIDLEAPIPPLSQFCCRLTVVEPGRNTPGEFSASPVFAVL